MTGDGELVVGDAWSDDISRERQAELVQQLQAWRQEVDHGERKGPFDGAKLTGADVFWLAARTLGGTGEAEAVAEQMERLRRARDDWELQRSLNLEELHLEGADLDEDHLEHATLTNAHLDGASLRRANLDLALLYAVHFSRADLGYASLRRANLDHALLRRAKLADANASPADFMWSDLSGADLRRANLRGSSVQHAVLRGALLQQADLHRTNLLEADLSGAHLHGAHLDLSARLGTLVPWMREMRQIFVELARLLVLFFLLIWLAALVISVVRGLFTLHGLKSLTLGILLILGSYLVFLAALMTLAEVIVRVGARRRQRNRSQSD